MEAITKSLAAPIENEGKLLALRNAANDYRYRRGKWRKRSARPRRPSSARCRGRPLGRVPVLHDRRPILAERFTVIAPDQRGVGMSSITAGGSDKTTMAKDLAGLLDHLGIGEIHLAGYDLGAGTAAAFARDYPARVRCVAFLEFGLAGFGYEQFMMPSPDWTLNSNWHLALFTVPNAAEWMLRGRERELLAWFFYHFAYSGNASVRREHFEAYLREVSKPGALRAGVNYYAAVWRDAKDNAVIKQRPLLMPALAVGGEASAGPYGEAFWKPVAPNLLVRSIPRAGHWLGDENPEATAAALMEFFGADPKPLAPAKLGAAKRD
jgi:pimeloyl-ACP methyl ester carboxylesterase